MQIARVVPCFLTKNVRRFSTVAIAAAVLALSAHSFATVFGSVRGIVHDPQHRPVQGAHVTLKAQTSDWSQSQDSSNSGEFEFQSVPIGTYTVTVSSQGFLESRQDVILTSDTSPVVHVKLAVAGGEGKRRGVGHSGRSNHGHGHADNAAEPKGHPANPGS